MPVDQVQEFFVHVRRPLLTAATNRFRRAMMQMIPQQRLPYSAQCLLHGRDLNHDIGAIPVLLDHFLEPANLAFDSAKPFQIGDLDCRIDTGRFSFHSFIIYPPPLSIDWARSNRRKACSFRARWHSSRRFRAPGCIRLAIETRCVVKPIPADKRPPSADIS